MRCQDSCTVVISNAEKLSVSLYSSVSTAQLTASAVSVILQGSVHHENEPFHNISNKENFVQSGSKLQKRNGQRNNAPPDRLPPLIEKLVGSVDPSLDKGRVSRSLKHSDVLVTRENKKDDKKIILSGDKQERFQQGHQAAYDQARKIRIRTPNGNRLV
jgi:hypothetical protein